MSADKNNIHIEPVREYAVIIIGDNTCQIEQAILIGRYRIGYKYIAWQAVRQFKTIAMGGDQLVISRDIQLVFSPAELEAQVTLVVNRGAVDIIKKQAVIREGVQQEKIFCVAAFEY